MGDQPMHASMAAGDQHMPAAQARAEGSSDMEQCSNQGRHSRGSPGTPEQAQEDLGSPHIVDRPPAMQPHHPFMAEPAAGIPQSSLAGRQMLHCERSLLTLTSVLRQSCTCNSVLSLGQLHTIPRVHPSAEHNFL